MNGLERILNTIMGKPIDKRGISLLLSLYGAKLTQISLENYYTNPNLYLEGQKAIYESFKPDIIFGPFALPLLGKAFGSDVKFMNRFSPNLGRPAIKSAKEFSKLHSPDIKTNPEVLYFTESIRLLKKEFKDDLAIAPITLSPIDLGVLVLGMDEWLNTVLFDDKNFQKYIDLFMPFCVNFANALLEEGGTALIIPAMFSNPFIITKDLLAEKTVPILKNFFNQLKGPVVFHSGGAPLTPFIDLYKDLPKVVGFVINGYEDIALARKKINSTQVIIGNIEGPDFSKYTAEELFEESKKVLELTKDDPYFILGTCGADIPFNTPKEKIQALIDAINDQK